MRLSDHQFKHAYHKPEDDLAADFYLPAVRAAVRYDRAVGFFSSTIFLLAWPSLRQFAAAGGRMRLICSPVLSDGDHEAMRQGYSERAEEEVGRAMADSFDALLRTEGFAKPARVLAGLVAEGVIDCRIAWVGDEAIGRPRRLFHDKVGILRDGAGDRIAFKGSMNETWPGLSLDGNLESVDVFADWRDEGEARRVADEVAYFERVWDNDWPGLTVRPFTETARNAIVSAAEAGRWPELVDEICIEMEQAARWSVEAGQTGGRVPHQHQVAALEAWEARGRRGILEHATGSGKTFTALCAIGDGLGRGEIPLVLVPSDLLLQQWERELRGVFGQAGLELMICGGGHTRWRDRASLRTWTRPGGGGGRVVLSTLQTGSAEEFRAMVVGGNHLMMVADEVHRMGAPEARRLLELDTGARLGLSATPERAGDADGTAALMSYFGGIVPPPFRLEDAIRAGALTPYSYQVHTISLDDDERVAWAKITEDFRRLYARTVGGRDPADSMTTSLKLLLIRRARIVKGARAKVAAAAEVVRSFYRPGQRWIVYCDDQGQLGAVKSAIAATGVRDLYEYHSAMQGDRQRTLELFTERGGVMVSIRCLDEGVDIPSVTHALILASSRNPREFIQRRGRVLRRFPGKSLAHLHDVIVAPGPEDAGDDMSNSILAGELARAIRFGEHAINPGSVADLRRIAARAGVDWDTVAPQGFETDDETGQEAEDG